MGSAYTPGLTVSADIVVRRTRRLPIKGETLVTVGSEVKPDSIVARALLPGVLQTIKLAEKLGVEAKDAPGMFRPQIGDQLTQGQVVAETKGLFGMFKQTVTSEFNGTVEAISDVTGNVLVREPSIPVDVTAYIQGKVADIIPEEGAIIETRCALVQGIFGIGGERVGAIRVAVSSPDEVLDAQHIKDSDAGMILIGGSGVTLAAMKRADELGVSGLIAGGVKDSDLVNFLGYDIGVAITGSEAIKFTLVVTEGFGYLAMANRTFQLFKSLEGQQGSLNGATQIRAGVIRPEVIVPISTETAAAHLAAATFELKPGTVIRMIREPYFGKIGTVTELPSTLQVLESGTEVRVLKATIAGEGEVTVPRANVEIIAAD